MKNYKKGSTGSILVIIVVGIIAVLSVGGYVAVKHFTAPGATLNSTLYATSTDIQNTEPDSDYVFSTSTTSTQPEVAVTAPAAKPAAKPTPKPVIKATVQTKAPEVFDAQKAAFINEVVTSAKARKTYPYQSSPGVTVLDMVAEPSAIHYYYQIDATSTDSINDNKGLKQALVVRICADNSPYGARGLLQQGINLAFSYYVPNLNSNFFASITESECE